MQLSREQTTLAITHGRRQFGRLRPLPESSRITALACATCQHPLPKVWHAASSSACGSQPLSRRLLRGIGIGFGCGCVALLLRSLKGVYKAAAIGTVFGL